MIVVYSLPSCFVCRILAVALKDSALNYRIYEIDKDISADEVQELYPNFDMVPFILDDGKEISLVELEKQIWK